MKKKFLDLILMSVGAVGALVLSILAIADSKAPDLISVFPATMLFSSMFIAGYLSYPKEI